MVFISAKIGDTIEFKFDGKKMVGSVYSLRENSVIVEYGLNERTGEPNRTIVNHKNYKVL